MRKKILAGNWKMNTNPTQGLELFNAIKEGWKDIPKADMLCIIAPPSTHLSQMKSSAGEHVYLSGQNCSEHESGAYTGEISAEMVKAAGADFVLVGHSERRAIFGETNEVLKQKINAALENALAPIYCCGESENQREQGAQEAVVGSQLKEGLFHLDKGEFGKVVVAYEPVWAIGTGKTASAEQAQEMHHFIRSTVRDHYDETIAANLSILYGGSCNPNNAEELFANEDVDGGLIGGASLKAQDFLQIANLLKG